MLGSEALLSMITNSKCCVNQHEVLQTVASTGADAVRRSRVAAMQVSVVIPTYNEADTIVEVIDRLHTALAGYAHEILVVDDDSPDLTWQRARHHSSDDPSVTVIRRIGRRWLASAVLDGMAAAEDDALAVIDGDLQHDESVLPQMVQSVLDEGAQVCVGTRAGEAGTADGRPWSRRWVTAAGAAVARLVLPRLRRTSDPLSGFFVVRRSLCEQAAPRAGFNSREYKILWPFLDHEGGLAVAEVDYHFRPGPGQDQALGSGPARRPRERAGHAAGPGGVAAVPQVLHRRRWRRGGVAASLCVRITRNRLRGHH